MVVMDLGVTSCQNAQTAPATSHRASPRGSPQTAHASTFTSNRTILLERLIWSLMTPGAIWGYVVDARQSQRNKCIDE
jgi:hypothetical protein